MSSAAADKNPPTNSLDPGGTLRIRRAQKIPWCRCILYTVLIIVVLFISSFALLFAKNLAQQFHSPHEELYVVVGQELDVVKPLLGKEELFDVAVSIWARSSSHEFDTEKREEEPLFSDIVFRGLTLESSKRSKSTLVRVNVPLEAFHATNLTNYDLRASFVLIPSSSYSSLVERIKGHSSAYPDHVKQALLPRRTFPFPLGYSIPTETDDASPLDAALDSFGITVPLLEFHAVKSACSPSSLKVEQEDTPLESDEDDSENKETGEDNAIDTSLKTTERKPVLKHHPYLVTRTHIIVVDETRLYGRQAYIQKHKSLKKSACGQRNSAFRQSSDDDHDDTNEFTCMAARSYRTHMNLETYLELEISEKSGSGLNMKESPSELLYAPYLTEFKGAIGPMDVIPIPVNREDCSSPEAGPNNDEQTPPHVAGVSSGEQHQREPGFITLHYQLSFQSKTPGRLAMAEALTQNHGLVRFDADSEDTWKNNPQYNADTAAYLYHWNKASAQDKMQQWNGLHGVTFHRNSNAVLRMVLTNVGYVSFVITILLDLYYWYTIRSLYGVSISATSVSALVYLAEAVIPPLRRDSGLYGSAMFFAMLFAIALSPTPLLMLKDVFWRKSSSFTHLERTSARSDAQIGTLHKLSLYSLVLVLYILIGPHSKDIISTYPPRPPTAYFAPTAPIDVFFCSILTTSSLLQLALSNRLHFYAGTHRWTPFFMIIFMLFSVLAEAEFVVGRMESRGVLTLANGIDLGINVARLWAVWKFRARIDLMRDKGDE